MTPNNDKPLSLEEMVEIILREKESAREDDLDFINYLWRSQAIYNEKGEDGLNNAIRFNLLLYACFEYAKEHNLPNPIQMVKIKEMIQMRNPELRYAEKKGN